MMKNLPSTIDAWSTLRGSFALPGDRSRVRPGRTFAVELRLRLQRRKGHRIPVTHKQRPDRDGRLAGGACSQVSAPRDAEGDSARVRRTIARACEAAAGRA